MKQETYIAKTLMGLEDVLAEEIRQLGGRNIRIGRRMVSFEGEKTLLYKANIHLRTAVRILKPLLTFKASDADEVYETLKHYPWETVLTGKQTFAIDTVVYSEHFKHARFLAYKAKDAVADYFREKTGQRPSVRITNPDIPLHIHVSHDQCTLALDSSGESLHKRGYRVAQTEAPLNEVLAAGMLLLAGWKGQSHFIDPMCGSGTLLIEAALIALNIPPGIYRQRFAFENWPDFDPELLETLMTDDTGQQPFDFTITGSDISPLAIATAEKNIRGASLSKYITLKTQAFQKITEAPLPGLLVTNPPYGERIKPNDLLALYSQLGERLKHGFPGYTAWVLSYREDCFEQIALRPSARIAMLNGSLECEFRRFDIFAGRRNDYVANRKRSE
jgi:putative N6-adenine-specific DNA methylase